MKLILVFSFLLATVSISGCGSFVPVRDWDKLKSEERHRIVSLPIFNESQLEPSTYEVINVVEGISCKNKIWDHAATKSDAINQTKYWASELGADGILNIKCDVPRGTTLTYNCWESITCTAQAIRMAK